MLSILGGTEYKLKATSKTTTKSKTKTASKSKTKTASKTKSSKSKPKSRKYKGGEENAAARAEPAAAPEAPAAPEPAPAEAEPASTEEAPAAPEPASTEEAPAVAAAPEPTSTEEAPAEPASTKEAPAAPEPASTEEEPAVKGEGPDTNDMVKAFLQNIPDNVPLSGFIKRFGPGLFEKFGDRLAQLTQLGPNKETALENIFKKIIEQKGFNINNLSVEQAAAVNADLFKQLQQIIPNGGPAPSQQLQGSINGDDMVSVGQAAPSVCNRNGGGSRKNHKKYKGGALTPDQSNTITNAIKSMFVLSNPKKWDIGGGQSYSTANDVQKKNALLNASQNITNFLAILQSADDETMTEIMTLSQQVQQSLPKTGWFSSSSAIGLSGGRHKKQRGGADDFIFSKLYNTQGLIVDNNDPIKNAMNYIHTADQIPQPFSSSSSGVAYSSGLAVTSLQDVLPSLGSMAGGAKKKAKSKRSHK